MSRPSTERADARAGTRDDAGAPSMRVLLFALLGGALAWSLHFVVSYGLIAWACTSGFSSVRGVLVVLTVLALAFTGWSSIVAWRGWHLARALDMPEDDAWDARMGERTARVSFIMVTGLILSIVFATGIIYQALTLFLVPLCQPGIPQ